MYLVNGTLHTPPAPVEDAVIAMEEGNITYAGPRSGIEIPPEAEQLDAQGGNIIPGLIDVHFHGCSGCGMEELETLETELERMSSDLPQWATTSFLIAPLNTSHRQRLEYYKRIAAYCQRGASGASLLGIHMEGPYISPEKPGAIQPSMIQPVNLQEAEEVLDASAGFLKLVTMAAEIPHAQDMGELLVKGGAKLSLGHSNATYEQAREALEGAFSQVTHCFNAMTGLHHRNPGIVGAILDSDRGYAELIVDGIHVHPAAVRLVYRTLGVERVIGITDAMPAAGLQEAHFTWGEMEISIADGKATLPNGTIAGSTVTMDRVLNNLQKFTGCSLIDAVVMCSTNPALELGIADTKGQLAPGFDADLAVLNGAGETFLTMVSGRIVYRAGQE